MPPKTEPPPSAARFGRIKGSLKMGIVGLPNIGKSSLFNLLTQSSIAAAENFPFCTIEPNEARCPVPDERYDHLCKMWNPPSKYPAFLQVTDIAGLVRGASEGAGLGNKFLSHIGAVDGIFHMVRAFDNETVQHVDDSIDPIRDLNTIIAELCMKDVAVVDAAVAKEEKDLKKNPAFKLSPNFISMIEKTRALLSASKPVKDGDWTPGEIEMICDKMPTLVTTKPQVVVVNMSRLDFIRKRNKWLPKIAEWIKAHGGGTMIPISVEWEQEYLALEGPEARAAFCVGPDATLPPSRSMLPKVITEGFKALELIFYITAGDKEVRCWTIPKGWNAQQAAGVIHTDFEKKFIKAEVVSFEDFKALQKTKGMADVKAAGKYQLQGKSYIVNDGDIIHFAIGK
eukprot:TRINITY_DN32872_c0_g1_i1.p1 TRINITY_DN32872_c0_g1~~TRINITY_DN32872_c0_g1_i1.p1  ORF type:complete len:416 (-),score=73.76 TRINITY_DN32872_c0_g1_i1:336-1529(-)